MKSFSFLILLSVFIFNINESFAQLKKDTSSVFLFTAGLNMGKNTNINNSSFKASDTYLPYFEFGLEKHLTNLFFYYGGIGYSVKGSNSEDNSLLETYRFQYLIAEGKIEFKLTDFLEVYLGVQPSYLVAARYKKSDSTVNMIRPFKAFELNIPAGFEITIQKHINLGFSYDIPNPLCNYINFKVNINVLFNQGANNSKNKIKKAEAYNQITELKNGALFFRLQNDKRITEMLIKMGKTSEAEKIKENVIKRNKEIIKSFKSAFNFCPVYFFFEDKTDQILLKNFRGAFINDSLEPDTTKIPSNKNFYIAEFGTLEAPSEETVNTSENYSGDTYSVGSYTGITALRILDSHLMQLEEPFPYFVRVYEGLAKRSYKEMVTLLNKRLLNFYLKAVTLKGNDK